MVGILAVAVILFVGAAIWLAGAQRATGRSVVPGDGPFCAHVSDLRSELAGIRGGAPPSVLSARLAGAQRELQRDAATLSATGRSVAAATAAVLATDLAQLRQAVLIRDAASTQSVVSNAMGTLASVPGC
jgi:hypothetical protein